MNKNNDNTNLKFYGYNLYSSSFASSPNRNISEKHIIAKKSIKNDYLGCNINTPHKRNKSENINNTQSNKKSSNIYLSPIINDNDKITKNIFEEQENNHNNKNENMKVMVRIRPPLEREIEFGIPFRSISEVSSDNKMITIYEYLGTSTNELFRQHEFIQNPSMFQQHRFTFDHIFDQDSTQLEIYQKAAKPSVKSLLEGYNSTILAYGQTGTGKTYTMEGFTLIPFDEKRGLVPRVVEDIFSSINTNKNKDIKFSIRTSYLQIYNEYISDLLIPDKKNLSIREDKNKGIFVDGLSEWIVNNSNDIYTLLGKGTENRAIASTSMNEISSRSHAIFVITLEQNILGSKTDIRKISKLNLVDLAGSERTRITGAKGKQLEESKKINKSLSALGNVIYALTESKGNNNHIPYRDSKLTRLLEDSLGGNCITTMITMISPCQNFISETLSSLSFSKRAKKIKNRPKINQEINHQSLIKQYEIQLKNLRNELSKKDEIINNNKLIQQINQLTEEKNNIIKQLENTSQMYLKEKKEKKNLEKEIDIIKKENNDKKNENIEIEKTPQFKSALEQKQQILLKEFDNKLQEYKNNKNNKNKQNNNNNLEIERYKNLIIKQREMMSDLTKKMNDRDETIIQLQDEKELLEKINEQQDYYLSLLNKNYKNLIDLCKNKEKDKVNEDEEILENYINIYKKINNDILNKYESKEKNEQNTKKYFPYNYSIENKQNNNINNISSLDSSIISINNINNDMQITLLTPEEKIKELNSILKEKENEIKILKLFSQKFLSNSCQSNEGKVNLSQIKNDFKNGLELYSKMREIEEERNNLKNENEQLKEKIKEYQNNIFKLHNILSDIKINDINNIDKYNMNKSLDDLKIIVDQLINNNIDNLIKENQNKIQNEKIEFNQKIQDIIKEKNENLVKIANSLNNIELDKKQPKKRYAEKKFINKFINVDK